MIERMDDSREHEGENQCGQNTCHDSHGNRNQNCVIGRVSVDHGIVQQRARVEQRNDQRFDQ